LRREVKNSFAHEHFKSRALTGKNHCGFFMPIRSRIFLGRKALQKSRKTFRWGTPPDPQNHERGASPKFFAFSNFYAFLTSLSMTQLHDKHQSSDNAEIMTRRLVGKN